MTTQVEAMKMMAEALECYEDSQGKPQYVIDALAAGRAAIEAAEKVEPFIVLSCDGQGYWYPDKEGTKLHLHPSSAEIEELRKDAFDKGWIMATQWSGEDHLLADMDSAAYKEERNAALEKQP